MWQSSLTQVAGVCRGSCLPKGQRGCSVVGFKGSALLTKSTVRAARRHYANTCLAMGKSDDPSQAFHAGQAKARSALDEMSNKGEFKRTDSTYRDHVKKGTHFEPEGARRMHANVFTCCQLMLLPCSALQRLNWTVLAMPIQIFILTLLAAAAGRYHLYIAYACPWASRCLAVRNLKVCGAAYLLKLFSCIARVS